VQALEARGLRRGDGVACLSANRIEPFLLTAASYVMGLRVTHLHPLAAADDQEFIIRDAEVSAFFFDPCTYVESARTLGARIPGLRVFGFGCNDLGEDILAAAATFEPGPIVSASRADDVCFVVYTGGTTGRPKGVMHTHRTHVALMMAELAEWEWPQESVFLAITPISHGAGVCIMPVLLRSGTFVMTNGFTPERFFELVQKHRVTSTFLVPTMIYALLDYAASHEVHVPTLELVIYGAAPMASARLREAIQAFGPIFMQIYAQSEAPNCVTVLRKRDHDPDRFPGRLASCGMPIYSNQVALLDEDGKEVPSGSTGEICVRGPLVMAGYWKRPEETELAFRYGWLHTGDLARSDEDGYLYIVGRSKDMIISGGFNVYPAEIEQVLAAHPAVSAVAVIGVPDVKWGEAVKAVVVLRPNHAASADELIARVREAKGAIYAPKTVDFVDSLPVTSLGKPDKRALRAAY
jgi:fatty-acyl-CoA synthase